MLCMLLMEICLNTYGSVHRIEFPCGTCGFKVENNDNSVQCDPCDLWYHTDFVDISKQKYGKLETDPLPLFCPFCKTEIPFSKILNNDLKVVLNSAKPNNETCIKTIMNRTRGIIKCFCQIKQIFNETNDLRSCDYYDIDELNKIHTKEQDLYIIHSNIYLLSSSEIILGQNCIQLLDAALDNFYFFQKFVLSKPV